MPVERTMNRSTFLKTALANATPGEILDLWMSLGRRSGYNLIEYDARI